MKNPRVSQVLPRQDYTLLLDFTNGEKKVFDVKPYLQLGDFCELSDLGLFFTAKPFLGSVQWANELDFCPDTLYEESQLVY